MKEYQVKVHDNGDRFWYVNGKLHRENGPACEYTSSRFWVVDGKRHRTDGPAVECTNGDRFWYVNDKRHRVDVPAREWANGSCEWYINGKELTEQEFNNYTNRVQIVSKKA
jgi:hypothetical protein